MLVKCPYCSYGMQLKGVRAGRFGPRCQKCGDKFLLVISDNADEPPKVMASPKRGQSEAVSSAVAQALGIPVQAKSKKSSRSRSAPSPAAPPQVAAEAQESSSDSTAGGSTATMPPTGDAAEDVSAPATPPLPNRMTHNVLATAVQSASDELDATERHEPSDHLVTAVSSMQTALPTMATEAPSSTQPPRRAAKPASGNTAVPLAEEPPVELEDPGIEGMESSGRLGGYAIIQKLGQGGMGAVYLARQVSLDRNVAVKILSPQLAQDPSFVARFTREAYAAAQLTHHNIVQIHDIGEDKNIHYFSMEFVEGQTLSGTVKKHGRLDPEAAVGYVLQAARGLKFAHDHAMIHRDIKPENLMLNDQGMVKVADLGLVKRRGMADDDDNKPMALIAASDASVTGAALSMGTPAYMAPEQARDATNVDARADIYSLGCTLYDMLTGRPPFTGKTVAEVLTKHAFEKLVPPDVIVKDVPKALSAILIKMMAKKPEDRYATMDDVIRALEEYLGMSSSSGPFSPGEEHTRVLEQAVGEYNGAALAKLRRPLILGFFGLCALLTLMMLWSARTGAAGDDIMWAGGFVGLGILTFVSYVVLAGVIDRTHVFRKIRQYVFGARIVDWAKIVLGAAVLCGLLTIFHLVWVWLGFLFAAAGVAAGYYFGVDKLLVKQRKNSVETVEGMLKTMRIRGLDEDALRQFVCNYSGANWEEFFEALFGYEAKIQARQRWNVGVRGRDRKKWGAWRDAMIAWLDARVRQRKEEKERRFLAKIEERKLRAEGVEDAGGQAKKMAEKFVARGNKMREADEQAAVAVAEGAGTVVVHQRSMLDGEEESEEEKEYERLSYFKRKYGSIWNLILGSQVRFVAGLIVLIPFGIWFHIANPDFPQNFFVSGSQQVNAEQEVLNGEAMFHHDAVAAVDTSIKQPGDNLTIHNLDKSATNLQRYGVNVNAETAKKVGTIVNRILAILGSYQGGLAGAILVFSAFFRGAKMGVFIFTASFIILLVGGDDRMIQLPASIPLSKLHMNADKACVIVGCAIAFLGLMFGRE